MYVWFNHNPFNAQGFFPNTYTMTKYMAEQLVQDYRTKYQLPLSIVRPSIISATSVEPIRGWVDTLNGVNASVIEFGRGTIGSLYVTKDTLMDLVPLDLVCNFIVVVPWFVAQAP